MRYNFLSLFILSVIFTSCNIGGGSVKEIKLIPVRIDKQYEYVDQEGKIVINPQFGDATVFRNGFALVQTSGDKPQWGFIGEDGKYSIPANYKSATVFNEEIAWVITENSAPQAIDTKGQVKFTKQEAEEVRLYYEGLAAYSTLTEEGETKWGFFDKEGKVKITPQFSSVDKFSDGKCAVRNSDKKWGYIDQEGKIIINYQFDNAVSFQNGKAVVISGGKAGLIDANGKFLINPQFSNMMLDGEIFLINQDGKYGWTDKDGKIIINPQFSQAYPFSNGKLAAVQVGKSWGYIDKEGKISINPQFDYAYPFNGNLALVSASKIGFIDINGKYVINPQYDDVSRDFGYFLTTGETRYGSVRTDFFNIGAITSKIKVDAPDGLTFKTTMAEIKAKYKKSDNDFSTSSQFTQVLTSGKISPDAFYNFYVVAMPWKSEQVTKGSGFYTYPETVYTFIQEYNPTAYAYEVTLTGKGEGKREMVVSAIVQSMNGYIKDTESSVGGWEVYRNGSTLVVLIRQAPGDGNIFALYVGEDSELSHLYKN